MKNILLKTISVSVILLSLSGCKQWISEALDIVPSDRYSVSAVWSTENTADTYLLGLYSILKENNGNVGCDANLTRVWDAYSDILKSNSWNQYNHPYNTAFLQGQSSFNGQGAGVFECWNDCYERIRRCNEFLRDVPVYGPKLSDDYVATRSGEMRFIRAFIYLKLMAIYGKCVLRDAVDGPEQNDKALATPDEIWDFIEDDLTYAANNISTKLPRGRITRAAAWGLLSRAMLYAGRWDSVINAAEKCKECGGALDGSYARVFDDIDSPENLLTFEFVIGLTDFHIVVNHAQLLGFLHLLLLCHLALHLDVRHRYQVALVNHLVDIKRKKTVVASNRIPLQRHIKQSQHKYQPQEESRGAALVNISPLCLLLFHFWQ